MKKIYFAIVILLVSLSNCKKEDKTGTLQIQYAPYYGSTPFQLNTSYPLVINDTTYQISFSAFEVYFSNQTLGDNGNEVSLNPSADAATFLLKTTKTLTATVSEGTKTVHVLGNIGLDSVLNASNPNSFAIDHPLSTYQNTYWGPWKSYRFLILEGKLTSPDGTLTFISYHTGINLYRKFDKSKQVSISENTTTNVLYKMDIQKIFTNAASPINPSVEHYTHTSDNVPLASKVMDNFLAACTLE